MFFASLTLLVGAVSLAGATQAHAQDAQVRQAGARGDDAQGNSARTSARGTSSGQGADYARYFGDGLRAFGEGNYEQAVQKLMRAYAVDSQAKTLALVISAYDKTGFCDAAFRQIEVFEAAHAGVDVPELARCASVGTVELECVDAAGSMAGQAARVNGEFDVTCGRAVRLPVGEHEIAVGQGRQRKEHQKQGRQKNARRTISVLEDEVVSLRLESFDEPKRWRSVASGAKVDQVPDLPAHVDRVGEDGRGYRVFLTKDGIYRVFVQTSSAQPPTYFDLPFRPNILRICDSGERFDEASHRCVPIEGMRVPKFSE